MTARLTCPGHHAHRGQVLRCELGIGHALPHAQVVELGAAGSGPELVTWRHDGGRRSAEAEALRWKREWSAAPTSLRLAAARLVAALAAVVLLVVLTLAGGRTA